MGYVVLSSEVEIGVIMPRCYLSSDAALNNYNRPWQRHLLRFIHRTKTENVTAATAPQVEPLPRHAHSVCMFVPESRAK